MSNLALPVSYQNLVGTAKRNDKPFKMGGCVWTVNDGGTRFFEGARPNFRINTEAKIKKLSTVNDRLAEKESAFKKAGIILDGIKGVEMHYPNEVNEGEFKYIVQILKSEKLVASMVTPNLFYTFRDGALSSTDMGERARAIEYAKKVVDLAYEFDKVFRHLPTMVFWPGGEGWNNYFERDAVLGIHLYADALNQIMDYDMQKHGGRLKFAFEAKPNEPKKQILIPTTSDFLALQGLLRPEHQARFGANPETAHEMLANLSPAIAVAWALAQRRLFHYHANWQEGLTWDQDNGVAINLAMLEVVHYMKQYGFDGFIGLDVQARSESKDGLYVVESSVINLRMLEALEKKVDWKLVDRLREEKKYEQIQQYVTLEMLRLLPQSFDPKILFEAPKK